MISNRRWLRLCLGVCLALLLSAGACGKRDGAQADVPAAPAMPGDWKLVRDTTLESDKLMELEYRLGGKVAGARTTLYQVQSKSIQLNTIVARDAIEADKIYRILANKKPPYAYLRNGVVLHEFIAGVDAAPEVMSGHAELQKKP